MALLATTLTQENERFRSLPMISGREMTRPYCDVGNGGKGAWGLATLSQPLELLPVGMARVRRFCRLFLHDALAKTIYARAEISRLRAEISRSPEISARAWVFCMHIIPQIRGPCPLTDVQPLNLPLQSDSPVCADGRAGAPLSGARIRTA